MLGIFYTMLFVIVLAVIGYSAYTIHVSREIIHEERVEFIGALKSIESKFEVKVEVIGGKVDVLNGKIDKISDDIESIKK